MHTFNRDVWKCSANTIPDNYIRQTDRPPRPWATHLYLANFSLSHALSLSLQGSESRLTSQCATSEVDFIQDSTDSNDGVKLLLMIRIFRARTGKCFWGEAVIHRHYGPTVSADTWYIYFFNLTVFPISATVKTHLYFKLALSDWVSTAALKRKHEADSAKSVVSNVNMDSAHKQGLKLNSLSHTNLTNLMVTSELKQLYLCTFSPFFFYQVAI